MGLWSVEIKTYPELNLEVMRRRLEDQYRFWLLARHLGRQGGHRIPIKRLRAFVTQHVICTRKTLFRALSRPSIFWEKYGYYLKFRGVLKVADALDVEFRSKPVMLPLACFSCLRELRGAFVASYFAGKPRTIAIDTLAMLTGRSRRTIIRYLQSSHIKKTPNVMTCRRDPILDLTPEMAKEGYFHGRVAGKNILLKRMPNTYETDLETAPRGITGKQRRRNSFYAGEKQVPPRREDGPNSPRGSTCTREPPRRLYYHKLAGANRALQSLRPNETVYSLSAGQSDDVGSQLWRGWTISWNGGPVQSR